LTGCGSIHPDKVALRERFLQLLVVDDGPFSRSTRNISQAEDATFFTTFSSVQGGSRTQNP